MNEKWVQLQVKIDALQFRERVLIALAACFVLIMLMQILLIDPLMAKRVVLKREAALLNRNITQWQQQQQILTAQLAAGVNRKKIQRKTQLSAELIQLDSRIKKSVRAMVPPHLMPELLESILSKNKKLRLLSIENKPVVSIFEKQTNKKKQSKKNRGEKTAGPSIGKKDSQALYKHSFVLQLEGSYFSAIDYFRSLQQLPWLFYWDRLHYKVESYPRAIITLEVHTLSMSEEWLGV